MVLLQLGLILVAYAVYRVILSRVHERRFKAFADQHGCKEAHNLSLPLRERLKRMKRIMNMRESGEDFLDDIIGPDFAQASTFHARAIEGSRIVSTDEPANVQAILATQFDDYAMGELRHRQLAPVLGKSIFSSDGAFWAHSRALFRPQFSRDNINDLDSTEKACEALISAIGTTDEKGWTRNVELQPLFLNFTLDTASEFLFGESLESQTARMTEEKPGALESAVSQAGSQQFRADFELIGRYLLTRIRLASLYWVTESVKVREAIRRLKSFTEHYVITAVNGVQNGKFEGNGKKDNLLSRLATQTQDIEELRNQVLAILLAGRETTAGLLGFTFVRLSLHPDLTAKLRGIILREFEPGTPITFGKLKGCRYLQHYLNEVLRLHPSVPINGRVATRDTTLPRGGGPDRISPVGVRKGQLVGYSTYSMHRRKDLWGEDALEFKPERWEQKIPAWQFLAFSGGPRICLGQQFALIEASYLVVRMLQHYDRIEPVDMAETSKIRKGMGLTLWPLDGVKVRLHEAKG